MRYLLSPVHLVILAGLTLSSTPLLAANAPIDPVPGSLTLGEIMDREKWNNGPRAPLLPVRTTPEPVAEATPFPVQEAPVVQTPAASAAPRAVRQVYPLPKR